MAPLIQFPIDLTRLVGVLGDIRDELARIREALQTLSPPTPVADPPRPAGLSDLRHTDPNTVTQIKDELSLFAANNSVMLDSDAFVKSIIEYEREVATVYGAEAINDLPWNKAAGGPLFQGYADNQEKQHAGNEDGEAAKGTQGRKRISDSEPASGPVPT